MSKVDEMISKSLDEIEAMTEEFYKGKVSEDTDVSKAQNDEDLAPNDVSDDAPEDDAPEESPEDEAPEEDNVDASEGDADADSEGEQDTDEDEEYEKSLESELKSNDSVRKALEVSEFLNELVKGISSTISAHESDLTKSLEATERSHDLLAKSFHGIVKSQKTILEGQSELMKSVRTLNKRLKAIEEQPMVRKSVSNAQAINKSFDASVGEKPKAENKLSKSQISAKLTEAFEGGKADLLSDVLAFDATGNVNALSSEARNILGL